jgi:hypothetical protein
LAGQWTRSEFSNDHCLGVVLISASSGRECGLRGQSQGDCQANSDSWIETDNPALAIDEGAEEFHPAAFDDVEFLALIACEEEVIAGRQLVGSELGFAAHARGDPPPGSGPRAGGSWANPRRRHSTLGYVIQVALEELAGLA